MTLRLLAAGSMIATLGLAAAAEGSAAPRSSRPVSSDASPAMLPLSGPLEKVIATKIPTPRLVVPIDPRTGESVATGRIVVKFRDDLGVRAPRSPVPFPTSRNGVPLAEVEAILAGNNATISQWINRTPEQLAAIAARAEAISGRPQPDLASIFFVDPPKDRLAQTAQALNDLGIVDWVSIDRKLVTHQQGCDATNAVICNQPNPNCAPTFTDCNPDPGDLMEMAEYGCADVACCNLVTSILPECEDADSGRGWDAYCAALANIYCFGTIYDQNNPSLEDRYDPCLRDPAGGPNPIFAPYIPLVQASCFEAHAFGGCSNADCCNAVCLVDPSCCSLGWDGACIDLAQQLLDDCGSTAAVELTPAFTATVQQVQETTIFGDTITALRARGQQVYTVPEPVLGPIGVPDGSPGTEFLLTGFRGGGLNLPGVRDLARQYAINYQNGGEPILNGRTINVGVIEFAAFVNHEDFVYATATNPDGTGGTLLENPKVIAEPGQTIILLPDADTEPDHGTATLGMIVAADNGFGVTGIAHEAQGWFFPIVSVEEGGRIQNAITSAIEQFEPGDVLNFSIGPAGGPFCGDGTHPTLVSDPGIWTLIRLATDTGILSCISAGNSSAQVEAEGGPIRSGAVIVGAAWPGRLLVPNNPGTNYCRLNFSNWHLGDNELGVVDVSGWGTAVTSTGYAGLFNGQTAPGTPPLEANRLRSYTASYGGTSAASPMTAGLVAVLQGWAKQAFGMPVRPEAIQALLADTDLNFQQCGIEYGSPNFPGNDDCPAAGDNLVGEEATDRHQIGPFPRATAVAAAMLTRLTWPSNVSNYQIFTGSERSPRSSFRLRAQDLIAVEISSQRQRAGSRVMGLVYLASGWTTDIQADTIYGGDPDEVVGLAVQNRAAASATGVFRLVYAFNWATRRWTLLQGGNYFVGPNYPPGADIFTLGPFEDPEDHIEEGSGRVRVRIWTCGIGAVQSHVVFHDFIAATPNEFVPTGGGEEGAP